MHVCAKYAHLDYEHVQYLCTRLKTHFRVSSCSSASKRKHQSPNYKIMMHGLHLHINSLAMTSPSMQDTRFQWSQQDFGAQPLRSLSEHLASFPPLLLPNFCSLCKVQLFRPASGRSPRVKTLSKPLEFLLSRDMRETLLYTRFPGRSWATRGNNISTNKQTEKNRNKNKKHQPHNLFFDFFFCRQNHFENCSTATVINLDQVKLHDIIIKQLFPFLLLYQLQLPD